MKQFAQLAFSIFLIILLICSLSANSLDAGRASHNPFLREIFKRQVLMSNDLVGFSSSSVVDPVALEVQVDRLVLVYLQDVARKTLRLKEEFLRVKEVRKQLADVSIPVSQRREFLLKKKERFGELAKRAKDLRKSLGYLFRDVRSKEDLVIDIAVGPENPVFEKELGYIEEQISSAEEKIVRYLFTAAHVVSVASLKEDTVLLHLYRVQKMSQALEKRI